MRGIKSIVLSLVMLLLMSSPAVNVSGQFISINDAESPTQGTYIYLPVAFKSNTQGMVYVPAGEFRWVATRTTTAVHLQLGPIASAYRLHGCVLH